MQRVVITGTGWVTPMGHDIESVWARLLRGESGIDRTTLFDASTFPTRISAEVKNFNLADHVPSTRGHEAAGRNTQFALAAAAQAWRAAGLPPLGGSSPSLDLDRVGIYL
ncbi:MAG TPA: beta-ketoacyl synthase N-terminal-like domain-containing protein, partial [Humisphaera sp.]